MDSAECSPNVGFIRRIVTRLRTDWPIKTIGFSLGMTAFFNVYFRLLKHPIFPVTIMPVTAVDRFVGFHPEAVGLYLSLWVYVSFACVLVKNRHELLSYGAAAATLSVVGLGMFLIWPTAVPQLPDTDWSRYPSFSFLKTVDASGNACPSLHVAFAVFTAIRLGRLLRELYASQLIRMVNWLWCLGIVYSTLATRQHVAVDALAGALLGAIIAVPRFRFPTAASDSVPAKSRT